MKKNLPLLLAAILLPVLFSACDDDYYYYDNDPYIVGEWELIYADGRPVTGYQVNYLEFYQNGTGMYYYYDNRHPYEMRLRWAVDYYYDSNVLTINYEDGTYAEMDYWYNGNYTRLYTSWYSGGGYQHTYVYQLIDDFSWGAPSKHLPATTAAEALTLPLPRPGTR